MFQGYMNVFVDFKKFLFILIGYLVEIFAYHLF